MQGMKRKRLTNHVKERNKERFGTANRLVKEVLISGYTVNEFEGPFRDYLTSIKNKTGGAGNVKVKGDMLVVYNKRSQRAITTWQVPDKYMPVDKYLLKKPKKEVICDEINGCPEESGEKIL